MSGLLTAQRAAWRVVAPVASLAGAHAVSVKALVADPRQPGRRLLVRAAGPAGRWELPGGRPRDGEDPADAARREVAEETGLLLTGVAFATVAHARDGADRFAPHVLLLCYAATVAAGSASRPRLSREHVAARWFSAGDLDRVWIPAPVPDLVRADLARHGHRARS